MRYLVNIHVWCKAGPCGWSISSHNVEYSIWNASLICHVKKSRLKKKEKKTSTYARSSIHHNVKTQLYFIKVQKILSRYKLVIFMLILIHLIIAIKKRGRETPDQFGEMSVEQGGEGRLFGGLDDHGTSGSQRRANFQPEHGRRKVPRYDMTHHSNRLQ